ncbi:MAG: hypothetical protein Q4C11_00250 [Clostridium sp.]|nr:hypothetical protein [Clostridium sp.]
MKMIIRDEDAKKVVASMHLYKSAADAFSKEMDVISLERNYIRKTLNNEMDYLMEKYKDNEVAQREVRLFNEIMSRMTKTDRRGDEIFHEHGFETECGEADKIKE